MKLETLIQYPGTKGDEKDDIMAFVIKDTEEVICNYCNIDRIPEGLENTSYRMAMDLYRNENIGNEDGAIFVSSLTEGDTSTSFKQTRDDVFKDSLLKNHKKILDRYRKVGFG